MRALRVLPGLFLLVLLIPSAWGTSIVWQVKANLPTATEGAAVAAVDGSTPFIYLAGGCTPIACDSAQTLRYDPSSNSWTVLTTTDPMPLFTAEGAGAGAAGKMFVVGGRVAGPGSPPSAALRIFDPSLAPGTRWSIGVSMPTPRAGLTVVSVLDPGGLAGLGWKIFAIGGRTITTPGSGVALAANEMYDVATATWTVKAPMPTARMDVAGAVIGGKIYVVGGSTGGAAGITGALQVYDPSTNTWSPKPSMTPRTDLAAGSCDNTIVAAGGTTSYAIGSGLSLTETFDVASSTWSAQAPMPTPRFQNAGASLGSTVYVLGGGGFASETTAGGLANEAAKCEFPVPEFSVPITIMLSVSTMALLVLIHRKSPPKLPVSAANPVN